MARWRLPCFLAEPRAPSAMPPFAGARDIAPGGDGLAAHLARVASALADDPSPRVLMGDCVASLPILAAQRRRGIDPAVVWFDAHGDFNTWATTPSGFIGGMPLAMCCGVLAPAPDRPGVPDRRLLDATGLAGDLVGERVLVCDARDLDPGERLLMDAAGIARIGAEEMSAACIPPGPLYLHVDLDVLHPTAVAGLLYPAAGGPGAAAVRRALELVLATGRVVAVGVAVTWDLGDPTLSAQNAHLAPLLEMCLA